MNPCSLDACVTSWKTCSWFTHLFDYTGDIHIFLWHYDSPSAPPFSCFSFGKIPLLHTVQRRKPRFTVSVQLVERVKLIAGGLLAERSRFSLTKSVSGKASLNSKRRVTQRFSLTWFMTWCVIPILNCNGGGGGGGDSCLRYLSCFSLETMTRQKTKTVRRYNSDIDIQGEREDSFNSEPLNPEPRSPTDLRTAKYPLSCFLNRDLSRSPWPMIPIIDFLGVDLQVTCGKMENFCRGKKKKEKERKKKERNTT